jgi:hypothetical protein
VEETEIYIDLFDQYSRNEISSDTLFNSMEDIDRNINAEKELMHYKTALMILEQHYLKEMIREIGRDY